jgi:RND family efflux transporter MFP subunit
MILIVLSIALLSTGIIFWWLRPGQVHLATITVTKQTLQNKIFASGEIKPAQRQVLMQAELSGSVDQIKVQVGQHVTKGQLLLTLQNETQSAALSAARTAVAEAQKTLNTVIAEQGTAPSGFQAQFQGTVASAKTSLASASAQLAQAKAAYDATLIHARLNGTVIMLNPNGIDLSGNAAPVIEVVGQQKRVVLQVSQVDAVHIKKGMKTAITTDAYPGKTWDGSVERVAPFASATNSGTGEVEVDVQVTTGFPVPFGYQVDVHIVSSTHKEVPVVPYSALIQAGSEYAVYVYQNHHVYKRIVTLGITTNTEVEVKTGLSVGDTVVLNPPATLHDGEAVSVS